MIGNQVLLVDDDPQITRMIRRVAEQAGLMVKEINDALLFEEEYQTTDASLIILDLNMPGKDGIELLDFLADQNCKSRVMFISGADKRVLGATEHLAIARGLNFAGVLEKPVDVARLRKTFDDHAKRHGVPAVCDLDNALELNEITVAYQAKIDLKTGELVGAEALARWDHPVLGAVSPEVFVSMAEDTGRIDKLTQAVIGKALRDACAWSGLKSDLHLAINLSPQLLSDILLPDRLAKTMQSLEFEPERLTLEITERGVMEDVHRSMAVLSRLRLKGIGLSIDDFGTGSSSLVQLYRMPFGEIKIDKSFVIDMLSRREAEVIVDSIIQLGKSLELNVVAEGVEDQDTLERLKTLGSHQAQGYFINRPLPEPEFSKWMQGFLRE